MFYYGDDLAYNKQL